MTRLTRWLSPRANAGPVGQLGLPGRLSRRGPVLRFEPLEDRVVPAINIIDAANGGTLDADLTADGVVSSAGGTISLGALTGVAANVDISVTSTAGDLTFDDMAGNAVALLTGAGKSATFAASAGSVVFAGGGDTLSTANGSLTLTASGALDLQANANAGTGTVSVTAGSSGNDSVLTVAASVTVAGSGGVTLVGDNITLGVGASVNAGAGTATLRPFEAGTLIDLGGADGANTLGLTDAELDRVTAGAIRVGDANSGNASVTAIITTLNTLQLELTTGGSITDTGAGQIIETRLGLTAGTGIGTSGNPLDLILANLEAATAAGGIVITATANPAVIGGVSGAMTGLTAPGDIVLTNTASVTLAEGVASTGGGDVSLTTGADLAVNAAVTASGGSGTVTLQAANNVGVSAAVSADGAGDVTVNADSPSDGTGNFTSTTGGTLTTAAGFVTVSGANVTVGAGVSSTGGGGIGLTATEATGDVAVNAVVTATGGNGNVSLSSLDDITVNAAVSAVGTGTFTATASDFSVTSTGSVATANGGVSVTAATSTVGGAVGTTGSGSVSFSAGLNSGTTFTNQSAISSASGNVTIRYDSQDFQTGSTITVASNREVNLRANTGGVGIDLGSTAAGLNFAQAELDTITGGQLRLTSAANTTFSQSITLTQVQTLVLETVGGVIDGTAGEQTDLTVNGVAFKTNTGIGSADDLDLAVTNLAFRNVTSGAVNVSNAGAVTINSIFDVTTSTNSATGAGNTTAVTASSPITFAVNTTTTGDTTYTAGETNDTGTFADDLTVNAGVTVSATAGSLTLQAGDDIVLNAGSTVSASGSLTITAGFGDLDGAGGLALDGTASGDPLDLSAINNIVVGTVTGGTVTITSTQGAILDGNDGATVGTMNVTATSLALSANKGIGVANAANPAISAAQAPLEVDAATLTVANTGAGAAGDIAVTDTTGGVSASWTNAATGGAIALTALAGGTLTVGTGNLASTNGDITLTTDDLAFAGGGTVNAGTAAVTLQQQTATFGFVVGTTGSNALLVADAELDLLTAGVVRLGRTTATGNFDVAEAITAHAGFGTLHLRSGGGVTQTGGAITVGTAGAGSLAVSSVGAVALDEQNAVATLAANVTGAGAAFSFTDADALALGTADGVNGVATNNAGLTVSATAGNLTVSNTAAAVDVTAGSGTIFLIAGNGVTHTFANSAGAVISGTGNVFVLADNMALAATSQITTTGVVELRPNTGVAIDVGGADSAVTPTLGLTGTELDTVTAGVLGIGVAGTAFDSGPITVTASVAPAGTSVVRLRSGGGITQTAGATITETGLRLQSAATIALTEANDVDTLSAVATGAGAGVAFTDADGLAVGTVDGQVGVSSAGAGGTVNLTAGAGLTIPAGVSVSATGATTLNVGAANAGSSSSILGTVSGSTVTANGGTGNDILFVDFTGGAGLPNGLTFNGNGGTADELRASDAGDATARTYTVSGTQVARGGTAITLGTGVESADVTGGTGDDTFNVAPSAGTTFDIHGGDPTTATGDTLAVSGAATAFLTTTGTGTFAGTYDFPAGTLDVTFDSVETLSGGADAVSVTNTNGGTTAVPGTTVTSTVVVTNTGGVGLTGVRVQDTFPAALTGVTWSAVFAGTGSTGTANGTGNIDQLVTLAAGGTATYTITGTVAPTALGTLATTATVTPPGGTTDTAGNNSATDTDTLVPTGNVSVVVTDGATTVAPGGRVTYTMTVRNSGPSTAAVLVTDTFPAALAGVTFTASAAGGATGASNGSGNLSQTLTLPANGSVTYTVTATVRPNTPAGSLVNTATATVQTAGFADTVPGNEMATDTTAVTAVADLAVTVAAPAAARVGTPFSYSFTVTNGGPSAADNVTLSHVLPLAAKVVGTTSTAGTPTVSGVTMTVAFGALAVGQSVTVTVTLSPTDDGTFALTGAVASATPDADGASATASVAVAPPPQQFLVASVTGGRVTVLDADGQPIRTFSPFGDAWTGPINLASGDVTGDGVPDQIFGAGPGGGARVVAYDGMTGALVHSFLAFPGFTGGVTVAAGDVNGDGVADVIVAAGPGAGPHVKVFSGADGAVLRSFFAYAPAFAGGVEVAAGDVNGDGLADIVTGAGTGGTAHVKAFDGGDLSLLHSFFAYPGFGGGPSLAVGDLDADGFADIVTGAGAGGTAHVKTFDGQTAALRLSFLAYPVTFLGGVEVAAVDADGDGDPDIVTAPRAGGALNARAFDGRTSALLNGNFAGPPRFFGDVLVG